MFAGMGIGGIWAPLDIVSSLVPTRGWAVISTCLRPGKVSKHQTEDWFLCAEGHLSSKAEQRKEKGELKTRERDEREERDFLGIRADLCCLI